MIGGIGRTVRRPHEREELRDGGAPWFSDLDDGGVSRPALFAELAALADRHAATKGLARFVVHPAFPVDVRHNAKIGREALAAFVGLNAERLPVVGVDGRLLGSLSKSDLLLAMVEQRKRPAA